MTSMQFTQRAERAFSQAHALASAKRNPSLEPAHIALAMIHDAQSLLAALAQSTDENVSRSASRASSVVAAASPPKNFLSGRDGSPVANR